MAILRVFIMAVLASLPALAEDAPHVVGAVGSVHRAAPQAANGEGDYGFTGGVTGGAERSGFDPADAILPDGPDIDLLAYEAEEAELERDAALAADADAPQTSVID